MTAAGYNNEEKTMETIYTRVIPTVTADKLKDLVIYNFIKYFREGEVRHECGGGDVMSYTDEDEFGSTLKIESFPRLDGVRNEVIDVLVSGTTSGGALQILKIRMTSGDSSTLVVHHRGRRHSKLGLIGKLIDATIWDTINDCKDWNLVRYETSKGDWAPINCFLRYTIDERPVNQMDADTKTQTNMHYGLVAMHPGVGIPPLGMDIGKIFFEDGRWLTLDKDYQKVEWVPYMEVES